MGPSTLELINPVDTSQSQTALLDNNAHVMRMLFLCNSNRQRHQTRESIE